MIPLRDENPTHRPAVVTVGLIVACVATFIFVQPDADRSLGTGTGRWDNRLGPT